MPAEQRTRRSRARASLGVGTDPVGLAVVSQLVVMPRSAPK